MNILNKAAASSVAIAMAMTGMPSYAATSFAPVPVELDSSEGPLAEEATEYRRRFRRRGRVRAGDVIAGIGILAGIAVIASAASKSSRRDHRDRYPERRSQDRRSSGGFASDDLGAAVSACSNAAEQSAGEGARVEEIRSAARDGNGWRVSGELNDTRSFDCGVSNGGVDFIQLGNARPAI